MTGVRVSFHVVYPGKITGVQIPLSLALTTNVVFYFLFTTNVVFDIRLEFLYTYNMAAITIDESGYYALSATNSPDCTMTSTAHYRTDATSTWMDTNLYLTTTQLDDISDAVWEAYQKYLNNLECLSEMVHLYKPKAPKEKSVKILPKYTRPIKIHPGYRDKSRNKRKMYLQKLSKSEVKFI